MRLRYRLLAAVGTIVPACAAPSAHRGRAADHSASPLRAEEGGSEAVSTTGTGPPSTSSAGGGEVTVGGSSASPPADPTTTTAYVVTVPTDPPTTTTVRPRPLPTTTLPENVDDDEFTARDATTARVSWYGDESGSHTANGDRYDPSGLTFAHLSMPFGTRVRFCGPLGCVVAACTDRGPASWTGKTFDLSRGAFALVAPLSAGVTTVTWERVA